MKITSVKAILTQNDILDIIKEYVKVDGLCVEKVEIHNLINIIGKYEKISFKATIGIGNVYNNIVYLKVFDINVGKIRVFNIVKKIALKKVVSKFAKYGLGIESDTLSVDMNVICKMIPKVNFKLIGLKILDESIEVEAKEVVYSSKKESEDSKKKNEDIEQLEKHKDGYTNVRNKLDNKIPDKYSKIAEYAMILPDMLALMYRLFKDKRVNMKSKILAGGIIAYLIMPIDILPDFMPLVGKIDDMAVAFFGLDAIINRVPKEVILENWEGKDDIILVVKQGVNFISKTIGNNNVYKINGFIKKFSHRSKEGKCDNKI